MDTDWLPADTYDGLLTERLVIVAELLRGARDGAAEDHKPETGESALSLGVSAWERSKAAICVAAPHYPWLHIAHGGYLGATHFVFLVGGFPIRFYHGLPEEPPSRYRTITYEERTSQADLGLTQLLPVGHALRLAVVTGSDNRTSEIHVIEYIEAQQQTVRSYQVPLIVAAASATPPASNVTPIAAPAEGVALAPPTVDLAETDTDATTNELPAAGDGTHGE